MTKKYIKKILDAHVYDVASETPLDIARALSKQLNNQVLLKREDLQSVFSFKIRGAYNRIYNVSQNTNVTGVIAASAGNHAQGVALSAKRLGIKATIVMPKTTPGIKVKAVRSYGAKVVLIGDGYDDAYDHAIELAKQQKLELIHPFDDPDVIAGQGTIAMEILHQHEDHIDAVFVPVGGGGLIAGVGAYIKELRPDTKVIGVEPEDAASMATALKKIVGLPWIMSVFLLMVLRSNRSDVKPSGLQKNVLMRLSVFQPMSSVQRLKISLMTHVR